MPHASRDAFSPPALLPYFQIPPPLAIQRTLYKKKNSRKGGMPRSGRDRGFLPEGWFGGRRGRKRDGKNKTKWLFVCVLKLNITLLFALGLARYDFSTTAATITAKLGEETEVGFVLRER